MKTVTRKIHSLVRKLASKSKDDFSEVYNRPLKLQTQLRIHVLQLPWKKLSYENASKIINHEGKYIIKK